MRGDRRSASFRKEKPAGLSRALSWLNVSNLSRQSRRVFQSQNELNVVHSRHPYSQSHSHLHTSDGDEGEDDDNWVYRPQHKIGESGETKKKSIDYFIFILDTHLLNHVCWLRLFELVRMVLCSRAQLERRCLHAQAKRVLFHSLSYGTLFSISTTLTLPGSLRD